MLQQPNRQVGFWYTFDRKLEVKYGNSPDTDFDSGEVLRCQADSHYGVLEGGSSQ
jgi:hypothetical protein